MWPHQAHVLAPLTTKTGAPKKGKKQAKFLWTPKMQSAFEQMKAFDGHGRTLCLSQPQ
jgi:hypothetical protein